MYLNSEMYLNSRSLEQQPEAPANTGGFVMALQGMGTHLLSGTGDLSEEDLLRNLKDLTSTLLAATRSTHLSADQEADLWLLVTLLWDAASKAHQSNLFHLGRDLYAVVAANCTPSLALRQRVASLSFRAGKLCGDDRWWCLEQGLQCARQLESVMSTHTPAPFLQMRQTCIADLFGLYVQAAKEAKDTGRTAVANNLLTHAVRLTRDTCTPPSAVAGMSCTLAELHLELAQEGGPAEAAVALVLLTAATQHLDVAAGIVELNPEVHACLHTDIREQRRRLTLPLAQAYLATGEAARAIDKLVGFSGAGPDVEAATVLRLQAHLALEEPKAAVKQLYSLATAALDGEPDNLRKSLKSWCSVCEELFAALPPLVASDCWEELAAGLVAAALSPQHSHGSDKLVDISEAIFNHADTQECVEWGVQLLTRPDVFAAIFRTRGGATECHHTLESAAAGRFWRGDYQGAELVYRAALQFLPEGPGEARNRTSACVAACNYALKRMVRAKEYMGCALHQIMAPPATHCLLTLQLVVEMGGSAAEVAEAITMLTHCTDFQSDDLALVFDMVCKEGVTPHVTYNLLRAAVDVQFSRGTWSEQGASLMCALLLELIRTALTLAVTRDGQKAEVIRVVERAWQWATKSVPATHRRLPAVQDLHTAVISLRHGLGLCVEGVELEANEEAADSRTTAPCPLQQVQANTVPLPCQPSAHAPASAHTAAHHLSRDPVMTSLAQGTEPLGGGRTNTVDGNPAPQKKRRVQHPLPPAQGPGWLDRVMGAQRRMLGGSSGSTQHKQGIEAAGRAVEEGQGSPGWGAGDNVDALSVSSAH